MRKIVGNIALLMGFLVYAGCDQPGEDTLAVGSYRFVASVVQSCQTDADCVDGVYCLDGRCVFDCTSDADCRTSELCENRGRCVDRSLADKTSGPTVQDMVSISDSLAEGFVHSFDIYETPPFIIVSEDSGEVEIPYLMNTGSSGEVYTFRMETRTCESRTGSCRDFAAGRTVGLKSGRASVSTQYSGLSNDRDSMEVRLVGHGADLRTTIIRGKGMQGRYEGTVAIRQFAGAKLPITFDLLLEPEGATLETASRVQWVLAPGIGPLDAPVAQFPDGFRVELGSRLIAGQKTWSGVAQYSTRLEGTSLGKPRLFENTGHDSVIRSIRVELKADERLVMGELSDRYTGLVNISNEDGQLNRITVSASGPIAISDILPLNEEFKPPTERVNLSELPDVDLLPWACQDAMREVGAASWAGLCVPASNDDIDMSSCAQIINVNDFAGAPVEIQRACVSSLMECVDTKSSVRSSFTKSWDDDLNGSSTAPHSFGEILEGCRSAYACDNDACVKNEICAVPIATECVRDAAAYTIFHHPHERLSAASLMDRFLDLSAELSFGAQLAAYSEDAELRLAWLKAQLAEDFSARSVREAAERNMNAWTTRVLGPVQMSMQRLLDVQTTSVLASTNGELDRAALTAWLVDALSIWSKTVQDVSALTRVWSYALDSESARAERYEYQQALLSDFYVSAIIMSELLDRTDSSALKPMLAGLSGLGTANAELLTSFETRVFSRDAELFEDRSLTQVQGSELPHALANMQQHASHSVDQAKLLIDRVIADSRNEKLSDIEVKGRFETELSNSFNEIVEMCGNPNRCNYQSYRDGRCRVGTDSESCGVLNPLADPVDSGALAHRARLQVQAALEDLGIAENAIVAQARREEIAWQEYQSLTTSLELANAIRMMGFVATKASVERLKSEYERAVERARAEAQSTIEIQESLLVAASKAQAARLQIKLEEGDLSEESFRQMQAFRVANEERQKKYIRQFEESSYATLNTTLSDMRRAQGLRDDAAYQGVVLAHGQGALNALSSTLPRSMTDVGAAARGALSYAAVELSNMERTLRVRAEAEAARINRTVEEHRALESLRLEMVRLNDVALPELEDVRRVEEARHAFQMSLQNLGIQEFEIFSHLELTREEYALRQLRAQQISRIEDADFQRRMATIDLNDRERRAEQEAEEARIRDEAQLNAALNVVHREATSSVGLELNAERARLAVIQSLADLQSVLNRAKTSEERFQLVSAQYAELDSLRKSPSAFFVRSNEIRRAEQALQRAREGIIDLIVAAEYFAVRPFIQERILANTSFSIDQMMRLNLVLDSRIRNCGGRRSGAIETLSTVRDILKINGPVRDDASGRLLTEKDQFQLYLSRRELNGSDKLLQVLERHGIDIQNNIRRYYIIDVPITVANFSVLEKGCGGRLASMRFDLIGDVRGRSGARPQIEVVTAEASDMSTCHLDVPALVEPFRHMTNFGKITTFNGPIQIGPAQATINGGFDDNYYELPAGRPVAGRYLFIIDREANGNRDVDWSKLEDIAVEIRFSYQAKMTEDSRCSQ